MAKKRSCHEAGEIFHREKEIHFAEPIGEARILVVEREERIRMRNADSDCGLKEHYFLQSEIRNPHSAIIYSMPKKRLIEEMMPADSSA